jgi:hypothetical protein
MKKLALVMATSIIALASVSASAASFDFTFDTTSTLFGGPNQTIRGTFTTLDTPVDRSGYTGLQITGISGTINGTAISGLYNIQNNPYYYITSGPTFLDGSGVRFNAGAASNIAFFHQDNVANDVYRVNGNGTISAFGPATSSPSAAAGAVPESATWMMMIIGFGGIGFAMRRKSKVFTTVRYA